MQIGINLSARDTVSQFKLGTAFEFTDTTGPTKGYKYVQYEAGTAGAAGVAGEVTYYYQAAGYETSIVTSDVSDSVNIGAGVLQVSLADGEFGWIQTGGPADLSIALTAGVDGNALTPVGAGDGTLDVSALVTDPICAYADDASEGKIVCCFPK